MKGRPIKILSTLLISLTAFLLILAETNAIETKVFRVSDGRTISFKKMIDDLKKVNLVFLGETHDRQSHHVIQLNIIKALNASKIPLAVGLEMFTVESQRDLDEWVAGTLPLENFIKIYYKNWGFPWPLYRDIFLYIRDNKISAIGLNIPIEISQKVATSGFSSLTKKEREKLPPEVGCAVDEKYMSFIRRAYAMHGNMNKEFLYFCEAQLLWDQVMARNLIEFLKKNPEKTVVVLTGNGHAWKRGIPEHVKNLSSKTSYRVILPEILHQIDPGNISIEDTDYIFLQE
ncbi:MAG: ChaN family lipoprotein [Nitrospirota bacterium]